MCRVCSELPVMCALRGPNSNRFIYLLVNYFSHSRILDITYFSRDLLSRLLMLLSAICDTPSKPFQSANFISSFVFLSSAFSSQPALRTSRVAGLLQNSPSIPNSIIFASGGNLSARPSPPPATLCHRGKILPFSPPPHPILLALRRAP